MNNMKNEPKEKPEIEQIPQTGEERPIPPDYIPEPKKHNEVPEPQEEEHLKEQSEAQITSYHIHYELHIPFGAKCL